MHAITDRFVIEEEGARHGGIGTIHRGRDRVTGEAVAIKVLRHTSPSERARFIREAELLSLLDHESVVRHVAHGFLENDEPFLVMQWLEGESLADRLARHVLSVAETMTLARRAAYALAFAHAHGLVHRDIKPANLFLVNHDVAETTLIDFGVARAGRVSAELTDVGTMVGTLGYMAPEQARGDRDVDARADVFSLGCVLYKCLVGRAPFVGDNLTAVLAKTLFEDAPRLADVCENVPRGLERLVARMLAKEPRLRPTDGGALLAELDGLVSREPSDLSSSAPPGGSGALPGITTGEQTLVSVVLATAPGTGGVEDTLGASPASREGDGKLASLRETVRAFGAQLDPLANGLVVATLAGNESATDQAAQAARCALAMASALGHAHVVLATGRGVLGGPLPVGFAIDRAVGLLRHFRAQPPAPSTNVVVTTPSGAPAATARVLIDEVTAGLLDVRFETRARGDVAFELVQERVAQEAVRTLLGRPTPFVGRSREIGVLSAIYQACIDEPSAQCVLVTGATGVGKSRLRYEFLRALRQRGEPVEIWSARGEPIVAGSPLRLLSHALKSALGLVEREGLSGSQQRLRMRVTRRVAPNDAQRVTEFLGELVGVPFPDDHSVQLRAARRDAVLRGDQMRRAFFDFIEAECAAQPIVLVLEDLHWGDLPTIDIVDAALKRLRDLPFMVIGLGRPDVRQTFPTLWAKRAVTRLEITELSSKASEKLVRDVLGGGVANDVVARLVRRAEGNAFFLEELIRAVADHNDEGPLPETVVAMVQSRLEKLPPDERRILRAASVFGEVFHTGGINAILGGYAGAMTLPEQLDHLVHVELVTRRPKSRFAGETEFVFRHAHVREAAYAMLTERDRALAHRLAGKWLEASGERDAFALAEHYARGGAGAQASEWYRRSAEQALEAHDLGVALERAERGVQGAEGERLGGLRLLQAEIHAWRGEHAEVLERGEEAMDLLPLGEDPWLEASGQIAEACGRLGQHDRLARLGESLCEISGAGAGSGARESFVVACIRAATQLMFAGKFELGQKLVAIAERSRGRFVDREPAAVAWIDYGRSVRALFAGDLGDNVKLKESVVESFERAGDERNACIQRVRLGYAWLIVGAHAEGERVLRDALSAATRMGLAKVSALAKHNLGLALARLGALDEARAVESDALAAFEAQGDRRLVGASQLYLAVICALSGNLLRAELHARAAVGAQENNPPIRAEALSTLASILLADGRAGEALEAALAARSLLDALGGVEDGETLIRLVHAQALAASGDAAAAKMALRDAKARLLSRAARIRDEALRKLFLEQEPDNRKTLELDASTSDAPRA